MQKKKTNINWFVSVKFYTAVIEVPKDFKARMIMKSRSLGLFGLK